MNRKLYRGLAFMLFLAVMAARVNNAKEAAADLEQAIQPIMKSADQMKANPASADIITLFLCGDVMPGRGIDQVLPYPSDPVMYESWVRNAKRYVELAENKNGPIPQPVDYSYIWGDGLAVLADMKPDLRIINLETSVTTSNQFWRGKGINYRMHPRNIEILPAAGIDCCVLANNHVLDWGHAGLIETLHTLKQAGIKVAGAGKNQRDTKKPAALTVAGKGRVLVFAYGSGTSGIPSSWAAGEERPGVNLLPDLSANTVKQIQREVEASKQQGDIVLVSLHWGANWGYTIPADQRRSAHQLIAEAGVDIIHGHSSHHVKGIEVFQGKLILYGCGDFLNDYEGIAGYERYRDDLSMMYFASLSLSTGKLVQLRMMPMQIKRFQTIHAGRTDALWLQKELNREGKQLSTWVELDRDGALSLHWQ